MKENIANCTLVLKTSTQNIQYVTFAHISLAKANHIIIFNLKWIVWYTLKEKEKAFVSSFDDYPKGYLPSIDNVPIYTPTSNVARGLFFLPKSTNRVISSNFWVFTSLVGNVFSVEFKFVYLGRVKRVFIQVKAISIYYFVNSLVIFFAHFFSIELFIPAA